MYNSFYTHNTGNNSVCKANTVLRERHRSVVTKRELQTPQNFQFTSRSLFLSSHTIMNLGQWPKE